MNVFRMIRVSVCALAIAAFIGFASGDAQGQIIVGGGWGHGGHGGHGGGWNGGGWNGGGWHGGGVQIGGGGWGGGYHQPAHTWHDTSHYDYHPGQYVPHGNHYHYQPGHYDWHQQGHIDHNHP